MLQDVKAVLDEKVIRLGEIEEVQIDANLSLKFFPATKRLDSVFEIGIKSDNDSGGFILQDIQEALKYILPKKEDKILPHFHKYEEWWLALVDYIGYGIEESELIHLRDLGVKSKVFNKIIFVSSLNPSKGAILDLQPFAS